MNQNLKNKNSSTFVVDGETINDPATISNKFNNYFVELQSNPTPNFSKNLNTPINPFSYIDKSNNFIFFFKISEIEILLTVISLKIASAGWDNIPHL